ncbi:MAG: riboflavin biosynthesis protein RibF [Bacteroidales bacterium]|nr:riboflavin biosynthesis protein RibF [Bacteroidales bacterium]
MTYAAAIGTFDGLHRGHVALLEQLRTEADARGLSTLAVTFSRHPAADLCPGKAPSMLDTDTRRMERLSACPHVDSVMVLDFSRMRHLTACGFMEYLAERDVRCVLLGHDTRFGSDMPVDFSAYCDAGRNAGIETLIMPQPVSVMGRTVSSSAIRKCLGDGDMTLAAAMLGRRYTISGKVTAGRRQGHTIGFPTANIRVADNLTIPAGGVYAAMISGASLPVPMPAMVNIGTCPTFTGGNAPVTVEAHIIGWEGDLYGQSPEIEFYERMRDEKHFSTLEALKEQLVRDKQQALDILTHRNAP